MKKLKTTKDSRPQKTATFRLRLRTLRSVSEHQTDPPLDRLFGATKTESTDIMDEPAYLRRVAQTRRIG